MKIVNLEEFRKLKQGTIFSKYEPRVFYSLMCKQETSTVDFFFQSIINDVDCESSSEFVESCSAMENGSSQPLSVDTEERNGIFDDAQLFAIYEKEDVVQLMVKLNTCLNEAY